MPLHPQYLQSTEWLCTGPSYAECLAIDQKHAYICGCAQLSTLDPGMLNLSSHSLEFQYCMRSCTYIDKDPATPLPTETSKICESWLLVGINVNLID